jgi:hypothetical protein
MAKITIDFEDGRPAIEVGTVPPGNHYHYAKTPVPTTLEEIGQELRKAANDVTRVGDAQRRMRTALAAAPAARAKGPRRGNG